MECQRFLRYGSAHDPLLELVLPPPHDKAYAFAEERRLFYVALTRARHGAYLITHPKFPSAFVLELLEQDDGLRQIGDLAPALPCPRFPNGRLVRSESRKTLRCTNQPHCAYQAPCCRNCPGGYVVVNKKSQPHAPTPAATSHPTSAPHAASG